MSNTCYFNTSCCNPCCNPCCPVVNPCPFPTPIVITIPCNTLPCVVTIPNPNAGGCCYPCC